MGELESHEPHCVILSFPGHEKKQKILHSSPSYTIPYQTVRADPTHAPSMPEYNFKRMLSVQRVDFLTI